MKDDYVVSRIKSIIASFVGIDAEDVEEEMYLSEFHIDSFDVIFLYDRIADEFDGDFQSLGTNPEAVNVKSITGICR